MRVVQIVFELPADGPSWHEFEGRLRAWIARDEVYGGVLTFRALWGETHGHSEGAQAADLRVEPAPPR